ncbi:MAG TPA: OFA family MFS transporter [Clostridia bacterium]|nr:OFA family MFS transporter [Clostridia bacterium]
MSRGAGVSDTKVLNRWVIVAAGIVIQLCLGTLYAFSVFRNPLIERFGWTITETSLAFTICLVFFTITMVFAGFWQDKVGPRLVGSVGGILLGLGCLLASQTNSLMTLYLAYGVIAGAGVGFAYVTPIATIVKWFPDKRGLMTGVAVFGFGAGSLVFAPLAARLIASYGVLNAFAILGVVFLIAVTGSAQALRNPPEGWKPPSWDPPEPKVKVSFRKYEDYSPGEMLQTIRFWIVWAMYLIGAAAGLMIISQAGPMAEEMAGLTQASAAAAVGILAVFNGLGRIFWGAMSDRIGRNLSLMLMFAVYAVDLFLVLPRATSYMWYVFGICTAALSFGGYLALMPAITADYFGTKNYGINYGWMFTAYGAAAVFGPVLIAQIKEVSGGYTQALYIFAVLSLIGIVLTYLNKLVGNRQPPGRLTVDPSS